MAQPTTHSIVIDVEPGTENESQYRAYCTDECGWQSEWQRAEYQRGTYDERADAAYWAAVHEGDDHVAGQAV